VRVFEAKSLREDQWHAMTFQLVMDKLSTSTTGLSEDQINQRLQQYGLNQLTEEKRVTPFMLFLSQFKSVLVIMLIISALISGLILEEIVDAALITIIIVINATLGFVQEYRAEQAIEALKKMTAQKATVTRSGSEQVINAEELVPGDIISLETGDRIPADARIFDSINLRTDEAPLTGESTPVTKRIAELEANTSIADQHNMVFSGTTIGYGRGKAIVVKTGMQTEFGLIAGAVQSIEEEVPPIKQKVEQLGRKLGLIAIFGSVLVAIVYITLGFELIQVLLVSVSLAVSAVPEGLPAVITITLALGAGRMARSRAIVRKLASVETLGSTTAICSDKTGTLTKNEMTVRQLYASNLLVNVTGSGYNPEGTFLMESNEIHPLENPELDLLLRIGMLCNNSSLSQGQEGWNIIGDPTEGSLIVVAEKADLKKNMTSERYPRLDEFPFESTRKRMSTIHNTPEGATVAYSKGAPEVILSFCDHIIEGQQTHSMNQKDKEKILEITQQMASEALRVLAFAFKTLPSNGHYTADTVENQMTFVGLVGMIDPPREEVIPAIQLCTRAGIRTFMITGDHKDTAVAVGKEIGLLKGTEPIEALTGVELDNISDEELEDIVESVAIYARASPNHKVRVAQALKKRGHIVAMTGDGVNDAPAIKVADIGVAMGIKGTDVTKEASDMVLEDDNFATIVSAVEAGRQIYDNIRKFVRLMLAVNFDEILEVTIAALIGIPLPLLPVQILWINLVTDGLPAAALSVDPKDPDIMKRAPRNPKRGLLYGMLGFILFAAVLDFCSDFFVFMWLFYTTGDVTRARTIAFTIVVIFELYLALNCRSETKSLFQLGWRGITANKFLVASILGGLVLQLAIVYVPFLQPIFHTTALNAGDLLIVAICSALGIFTIPELFIFPRDKAGP
jgi:Ca2+-transporting ATPase